VTRATVDAAKREALTRKVLRLKLSPSRDPERDRWVWRRRDNWTAVRRYVDSED
jgi:hypothetical protein